MHFCYGQLDERTDTVLQALCLKSYKRNEHCKLAILQNKSQAGNSVAGQRALVTGVSETLQLTP